MITRVLYALSITLAVQGVEERLRKIKTLLKTPPTAPKLSLAQDSIWARVVVTGMRQAGVPEVTQLERYTVRVRITQVKGLDNKEILKEVKKTISGAAAIRVLHSGDIDVTVPDKATRDRAQGLPATEELKVFRKDYLVKVLSVPLSTQVTYKRGADNTRLVTAICEASKSLAPGLQITYIR